jgi:type I restriction-modification system DNA methylase subunit
MSLHTTIARLKEVILDPNCKQMNKSSAEQRQAKPADAVKAHGNLASERCFAAYILASASIPGLDKGNIPMARKASSKPDSFRRALIEADLVDCMVALPGQLFYSTQIRVKEFTSFSFQSCN